MTSQTSGVHFSRNRLILAALIVIVVALTVGLIAGFASRHCSSSVPPSPDASMAPAVTTLDPNKPWLFILLPRDIVPSHYVIILTPDFYTDEAMTFAGEVKIEFDVRAPSRYILLHIKDIDVDNFWLYNNATGKAIATGDPFVYEKNNFWVLPAKSGSFPKGSYRIEMKYRGSLKGIHGFYKSSYYDPITRSKRHIVSSKFEPVDARRAFPSFDEPQLKAEFTVHLRHRAGYVPLSNMNNESTTPIPKTTPSLFNTRFARSVKMSTYLVCFVVCDFDFRENGTAAGKPFRVWAPRHKVDQAVYALNVGIKVQDYFEQYFNLPYALPKQDMIVIPNFGSGAMEHWGLITYRETTLLYDPEKHSLKTKFRVANVVAHELAHMWFGNVVTMKWWDDLWLNEGFASFASYKGVKAAEPSWDTYALARLSATRRALTVDDVITSHPIIMEVNTPAELSEAFDSITYSKGQSVILMLESLMGNAAFKTGIQKYMRKFEYKNAETKQLWSVLSNETKVPIDSIMNTWTLQMGYPVITFDLQEGTGIVKGNQTWFLLDPNSRKGAPPSEFNYLWWVRIDCLLDTGMYRSIWMNKTETFTGDFSINLNDPYKWFLCNKDGGGFYRVNYPPMMWSRLARVVAETPEKTNATHRATLIDDVFALAEGGQVSYKIAMKMLQSIEKETEFPVWKRANYALSSLLTRTRSLLLFSKLRTYIRRVTEPTLQRIITKEGKTLHDTYLRQSIIGLSCAVGSETCLSSMREKFNAWLAGQKIPLDIRYYIIRYGFKNKDTEEMWNELWSRYVESDNDALKTDIIGGLVSTSNEWLIHRLLKYVMNASLIKEQDFSYVFYSMISEPIARPIVWIWFRQNWEQLVDRFTIESRSIGKIFPYFAHYFYSEVQLEEMKAFCKKYPDAGAGARGRQLSLSKVESNLRWIAANERSLQAWLDDNVKP